MGLQLKCKGFLRKAGCMCVAANDSKLERKLLKLLLGEERLGAHVF